MDGGDFGKSLDNAIKGLGCFCFFVVLWRHHLRHRVLFDEVNHDRQRPNGHERQSSE